jgi:hypothetical protein
MLEAMKSPAPTRLTKVQQAQSEFRSADGSSSFVIRYFGFLLSFCLSLCFFLNATDLFAQCATCRAGGHCAHNVDGKCMANRTFWGYYQSNWRKWPSVVAAEQMAAYEREHTQSPASAAPSSVLPKPADEARDGNTSPGTTDRNETEESVEDTTDSPNDNIAPRRTIPQDGEKKEETPLDPSKQPQPLPEPAPVRPKLPGADLDDPAPILPVDPNDSVPSLPPNLRDMKPPADENLELDDLFKGPSAPAPKAAGGAAQAPGENKPSKATAAPAKGAMAPAAATMTPAERTAEFTRRRREHAERNRQFLKEKYANAVQKPTGRASAAPQATEQKAREQTAAPLVEPAHATQAAAANSPSTAASLDELTTLHRVEGTDSEISPRPLPAAEPAPVSTEGPALEKPPTEPADEHPAAIPNEDTLDETAPLDIDEPQLLLTPTDTASKNPLRENIDHARYSARMFTPQVRSNGDNSASHGIGLRGTVNPLRSNTPATAVHQKNNLREVTPVSYEEEVPSAAAEAAPSAPAVLTPIFESDVKLSPTPAAEVSPMPAVSAESLPQTNVQALREETAAPMPVERKSSLETSPSGNALRDEPAHTIERSNANPLRGNSPEQTSTGMETRGVSLPAKTPGTGRYMTNLGTPTPAPAAASRPVEAEPAAVPVTLGTVNPLR